MCLLTKFKAIKWKSISLFFFSVREKANTNINCGLFFCLCQFSVTIKSMNNKCDWKLVFNLAPFVPVAVIMAFDIRSGNIFNHHSINFFFVHQHPCLKYSSQQKLIAFSFNWKYAYANWISLHSGGYAFFVHIPIQNHVILFYIWNKQKRNWF